MQHTEFFDIEHFEKNYNRVRPADSLAHLIDFFWETKFDHLWEKYPGGFSDILFPNIGYTYLINLGTPFIMQVGDKKTSMKTDGFLPRHLSIECHHQPGNVLFGIKFKIAPILLEKKINFSEYKASIFPLSYLLDKTAIERIKAAESFYERVGILNRHFNAILENSTVPVAAMKIVAEILANCDTNNDFTVSIQELARHYGLSARTLQRYFEMTTSLSSKKTLQILRIRKAVAALVTSPETFDYKLFGYYDYSHFYKHVKQFFRKNTLVHLQPHLTLLSKLHKDQG